MNNALKDLLLIDGSTNTEQLDKIYDSVFNKIANDHQGVYFVEKIDLIDDLKTLFYQSQDIKQRAMAIKSMLNAIYYFEPNISNARESKKFHQALQQTLSEFSDEHWN